MKIQDQLRNEANGGETTRATMRAAAARIDALEAACCRALELIRTSPRPLRHVELELRAVAPDEPCDDCREAVRNGAAGCDHHVID
jgi:hypothetical protein